MKRLVQSGNIIIVQLPIIFRRRGVETKLVLANDTPAATGLPSHFTWSIFAAPLTVRTFPCLARASNGIASACCDPNHSQIATC